MFRGKGVHAVSQPLSCARTIRVIAALLTVVALASHSSPASAQAPCTPPQKLGVVFVIDDSSSMDGNDPQDLRGQGVGLGLKELGATKVAALSNFGSTAAQVFAPTELNDANIPQLAQQAAARPGGKGGTDYEKAFTEAKRQLDAMPPGVDRKGVVFLSDGEPNSAYTADKAIADAGIPIYPIGFGSADNLELQTIAQSSHGIASFASTPGEVQGAMARAIGLLSCTKVDSPEIVTIPPGGTRDVPFDVPGGTAAFRALASWGGGQVTARLVRPDGSVLGPGTAGPGEAFEETATYIRASATNPKPGRYKVRLTAAGTNPASVNVSVDLIGGGNLDHPLNSRPQPAGPGCQTEVKIYGRIAWSTCLRTTPGGYRATVPVRIAGLDFDPDSGEAITLSRSGELKTGGARMYATTSGPLLPGGTLTLHRGALDLSLRRDTLLKLSGDNSSKGKHAAPGLTVGGLPLDLAAGAELAWTADGASLKIALDLGREFATILGPEGGIDTSSGVGVSGPGAGSATLKRGFGLEVTLATKNESGLALDRVYGRLDAGKLYGTLGLKNVFLSYEPRDNIWTGGASVVPFGGPLAKYALPTISAELALTLNPLSFQKVKLEVSDINKPIGPIFLQKLGGEITRDPPPVTIGGTIGLSAGPQIEIPLLGKFTAVELEGSAQYTYPGTVAANGGLKLLGQGVADASAKLDIPAASGSLGGKVDLSVSGNGLNGSLDGWLQGGTFQLTGDAGMRVFGKTISGAEAFLSTRGMGACRRGWGPDFGFSIEWRFGLKGLHTMASSCDFGDLLYPRTSRQAGPAGHQEFTVGKGERGRLVRIHGEGGDPGVVVRGGGREFPIAATAGYQEFPEVLIAVRDEVNDDLWLVLNAPAPGTWTVDALPGSPPITAPGTARAIPEPQLRTTLRRFHGKLLLRYRLRPRKGQTVRFVERASTGEARTITTARRSAGTLRIRPLAGRAGTRVIEATIAQDGMPRQTVQAGRFKTRTVRPRRPSRARVLRVRGGAVRVSWTRAPGAYAYVVRFVLRDGRRFETTVSAARRSLFVPAVSRRTRGTVQVRALARTGVQSNPRSVPLR